MKIGKPAPINNGVLDLSGNDFGEITGYVVIAGRGAGDFVFSQIFETEKRASRQAQLMRSDYPVVEVKRLAVNVQVENGDFVFYDPTTEE
jgi:hypothetical protein